MLVLLLCCLAADGLVTTGKRAILHPASASGGNWSWDLECVDELGDVLRLSKAHKLITAPASDPAKFVSRQSRYACVRAAVRPCFRSVIDSFLTLAETAATTKALDALKARTGASTNCNDGACVSVFPQNLELSGVMRGLLQTALSSSSSGTRPRFRPGQKDVPSGAGGGGGIP